MIASYLKDMETYSRNLEWFIQSDEAYPVTLEKDLAKYARPDSNEVRFNVSSPSA